MLTDLHIHTDNSADAEHSITEVCVKAVEKHLKIIAITDHCEINDYEKDGYERAVRQSFFDVLKARGIFAGRLELLQGIELGNATADPALAHQVIRTHPYDFVIGSLHCLMGKEDFAFLDYTKTDPDALLTAYYAEMEHMVEWGEFDVLGHFTYPLRYINGEHHLNVDITRHEAEIARMLKKAIAKGIGIEINTSGLRQPYGQTLPNLWGLELYRVLGGKILTVGSDAHTMWDVGANITDGLKLAKQAGFSSTCVFRAREPVYLPIEG